MSAKSGGIYHGFVLEGHARIPPLRSVRPIDNANVFHVVVHACTLDWTLSGETQHLTQAGAWRDAAAAHTNTGNVTHTGEKCKLPDLRDRKNRRLLKVSLGLRSHSTFL